jgi:diguanylate cyclase (GGDEF)-like protein
MADMIDRADHWNGDGRGPRGLEPRRGPYAERLHALASLEVEEAEAETIWHRAEEHRMALERHLGRDVGVAVSLLDYLVNVRGQLRDARIIEADRLAAIEEDAVSDRISGLYNRRYFERALAREVERYHRYGASASLLMMDLDNLKAVNDTSGHQAGDRALHAVGCLIRSNLRAADVGCRWGGDEFAAILTDTPPAEAYAVAERIRADVVDAFARPPLSELCGPVTVSGGIATLSYTTPSADALVAAADSALYQAKRGRKNRVTPPAQHGLGEGDMAGYRQDAFLLDSREPGGL